MNTCPKKLITNILDNKYSFNFFLINSILNSTDCTFLVDKKGRVLFINQAAVELFGQQVINIHEINYRLSFEICILNSDIDIINYSPVHTILENDILMLIATQFETDYELKRDFILSGIPLSEDRYIITLSDIRLKQYNQDYINLKKSNQKLLEKNKEIEVLRTQAQSQAIREHLTNKISNEIRNSLEIDKILQTAVEELGKTLRNDSTILLQKNEEQNNFIVSNEYTTKTELSLKNKIIKVEEDYFLEQAIEQQEAISGIHIDNGKTENHKKFKLIVPIIHHEELFGVLFLLRRNRNWLSEEINLVKSVSDQISVSIKNARLFEDTTSKNIKISVLNEILKSINSSLILDDVFYTIGNEIRRLIKFDRTSIAILDEDSKKIKLFARIKDTGEIEILRTGPLITKGSALNWAIENLKPIKIGYNDKNNFTDSLTLQKSGILSSIIIPMVNKGRVTGIFYIGSKEPNVYNEPEVEIMSQIAGQVAIAVENAKLYWQIQTQALKETLINQVVSSIRKSLKLPDVLQSTVQELGESLGVSNCFFKHYIKEEQKDFFSYMQREADCKPEEIKTFLETLSSKEHFYDSNLTTYTLKNTKISTEVKSFLEKNHFNSLLVLRISLNNLISEETNEIGLIALCKTETDRDWTPEDTSLLKVLSDQIAITINQSVLFDKTQKQKAELETTIRKLKETQAQLIQSEKMAALGQLVAGVAHEINTPIGSINSNNNIFDKCSTKLEQSLSKENFEPNDSIKILNIMKETVYINQIACDRINNIIKNLKNFARLDESEFNKIDIHEGIESTLILLRHEIKMKVEIEKKLSKLPLVECYPNLLNQVFMNLLMNGIQSIKEKGKITIETKVQNDSIHIAISDTGIGISEQNLKKIFDPGFTTKGVGVGTGLGLSISFQIIEKHKGQILVESKEGEGSKFTIIIPIKHKT